MSSHSFFSEKYQFTKIIIWDMYLCKFLTFISATLEKSWFTKIQKFSTRFWFNDIEFFDTKQVFRARFLCSVTCLNRTGLVVQWNLSRLEGLVTTIQEFIFLYIQKLFECLYDHLSDLQIEKNDETNDTNNCVRFVSHHCYNDTRMTGMLQLQMLQKY